MTSVAPEADAVTAPHGAPAGVWTLSAWLAIVGAAMFVVFLGGALPFLHIPAARIAVQLIALVAALASVVLVWTGRIDPRTSLRNPVIACVVVMVASTALSSQPSISRESLGLLLLAVPLYPLLRAITWSDTFGTRLQNLIALAAVGVVVAYGIQVGLLWVRWWADVGPSIPPLRPADAALTTGTVNSLATYLELLVLPALWIVRMRLGMAAAVVLGIAATIEVVITGSRGAWIGLAAAGAVLSVLHRSSIAAAFRRRFAARPQLVPIILGIGVLAVAGGVLIALPRLAAGDAGRIELWQAAVRIGAEHPVLGGGPGTWQDLRTFESISEPRTAALFTPHNSVLGVFAETGLLGLAATGWLVLAVARLSLRSVRETPPQPDRGLRELTVASLVAVGVHSLVDPLFGVPGVALLVLLAIARLERPPAEASTPSGPTLRRWRGVEVGAATLLAVALLVPANVAMVRAATGNSALDRSDWAVAGAEFDAAIALDDRPVYRLGEAIAAAGLGDPAAASSALDVAGGTNALTFMSAANSLLAAGDGRQPDALRLAEDVLARGPYDPTGTVNAALVLYDAGLRDEAHASLATVMTEVASLTYSARPDELFDADSWEAARQSAIEAIRAVDPTLAAYCVIRAGGPAAEIDTALAALPDGPVRDMLDLLRAAETTGEVNLEAARAIVRSAPASFALVIHERLARLAGSQADLDLARSLSSIAFFEPPQLDQELVTDGLATADYSLRVPNYPYAMLRPGPRRPYPVGMVTIEPVLANQ